MAPPAVCGGVRMIPSTCWGLSGMGRPVEHLGGHVLLDNVTDGSLGSFRRPFSPLHYRHFATRTPLVRLCAAGLDCRALDTVAGCRDRCRTEETIYRNSLLTQTVPSMYMPCASRSFRDTLSVCLPKMHMRLSLEHGWHEHSLQ